MEPAKRRRWIVLGIALAATLVASFHRSDEGSLADVRQQTAPAREDRMPKGDEKDKPAGVAIVIPERLAPRTIEGDADDAFGIRSWAPPPPPPPKPVAQSKQPPPPPPKPTAPPLPYRYLGRLEEAGVATIFLGAGERNFAVKPGGTFDNNYRLDAVQSGMLTFTYLPLNIQQTLPVMPQN